MSAFVLHLQGGSALLLEVGETQGTPGDLQALAVLPCPLPWEMKQKRRSSLCAFHSWTTLQRAVSCGQAGAERLWEGWTPQSRF